MSSLTMIFHNRQLREFGIGKSPPNGDEMNENLRNGLEISAEELADVGLQLKYLHHPANDSA